jgi:serine protease Do
VPKLSRTQVLVLLGGLLTCAIGAVWYGQRLASSELAGHTTVNSLPPTPTSTPLSISPSLQRLAKQVTVRLLLPDTGGSGVMIGRRGNVYTVLTCRHVVVDSKGAPQTDLTILTYDGKRYPARLHQSLPATDASLDLVLLEFTSTTTYPIARPGEMPTIGQSLYASGFPNYNQASESTQNLGNRAFRLTSGQFNLTLERPLEGGYRLGSSNDVELGMSGGPLFNQVGNLVGINGRAKYPVQGGSAYTFSDGSQPTSTLAAKLETLSWAIPISSIPQDYLK